MSIFRRIKSFFGRGVVETAKPEMHYILLEDEKSKREGLRTLVEEGLSLNLDSNVIQRNLQNVFSECLIFGDMGSINYAINRLNEKANVLIDAYSGYENRSGASVSAIKLARAMRQKVCELKNYFAVESTDLIRIAA